MESIGEIETAIAGLSDEEFWKLTDRLIALGEEKWDRQIDEDARSGKLDHLFEEADRDFENGQCSEL